MTIGLTESSSFATNPCCPICLSSFGEESGQTVVELACPKKHLFDQDCLLQCFRHTPVLDRTCLICYVAAEPMVEVRVPDIYRLYHACQQDNAGTVRAILQKSPELANRPVHDWHTGVSNSLFTVAVKSQSREAALALIDHGLDVNGQIKFCSEEGVYPLHVAAAYGDVVVVAKLLDHGAPVDPLTTTGSAMRAWPIGKTMDRQSCIFATPIGWAVRNGHCEVVKQLLDAGSIARLFGHEKPPERELGHAVGYDVPESNLLSLAVYCDQPEIVRLLLSLRDLKRPVAFGLDDNSYTKSLLHALLDATLRYKETIVELLVGACSREAIPAPALLLSLWCAIEHGQEEVVGVMLRAGFKDQIRNYGQALEAYTLLRGHTNGQDLQTGMINSLFAVAVKSQSRETAIALFDHGLDVNSLIKYGSAKGAYPLHVAAALGDVAVVAKLLGNGAPVDCLTQRGTVEQARRIRESLTGQSCLYATPIGLAVENGHCEVVKQLLDAGSTARLFDDKKPGDTLLYLAIDCNQPEIVRFLLLLGDIKRPLSFGLDDESYAQSLLFALYLAAIKGHTAIVELLVGLCNTESIRSRFFLYPLWYAIKYGKKAVVEVLLKAGFNNQIHNYGQSLQEYALKRGNKEIVKLIDKYDANYRVPIKDKIMGMLSWLMSKNSNDSFALNHPSASNVE